MNRFDLNDRLTRLLANHRRVVVADIDAACAADRALPSYSPASSAEADRIVHELGDALLAEKEAFLYVASGDAAPAPVRGPHNHYATAPRFPRTSCSSCGWEFGPGNHGYSHCDTHADEGRRFPSASMLYRLASPTSAGYPGPDRPGRYYSVIPENGGHTVAGVTAWTDAEGALVWVFDDFPNDLNQSWTPNWPCYPAELLIRSVKDGAGEVKAAMASYATVGDLSLEGFLARLTASWQAVADAGIGQEVAAALGVPGAA